MADSDCFGLERVLINAPAVPYRRATFLPIVQGGGLVAVGAYNRDKDPIPNSLLARKFVPYSPPDYEAPCDHLSGSWIYGGPLFNQFGHFLLETLARLPAVKSSSLPIIWIQRRDHPPHAWTPWQSYVLDRLGLSERRHAIVHVPTEVERVIVPHPRFIAQRMASPALFELLGIHECSAPIAGRRVWLSRAGINPASPARIVRVENESEVEVVLRQRGWEILRPENHTVEEQLAAVSEAEVISGFAGSAFHLLALTRGLRAKVRIVWREGGLNANFRLVASAKALNQSDFGPRIEQAARGVVRLLKPSEVVDYADA